MGNQPSDKKQFGTETRRQGSPISGYHRGYETGGGHDEAQPNQGLLRWVRADVVNEKRHEDHDEIEAEGHSELREGNEENVSVISLIHRMEAME
jgi:hypothetical protein